MRRDYTQKVSFYNSGGRGIGRPMNHHPASDPAYSFGTLMMLRSRFSGGVLLLISFLWREWSM